MEEKRIQILKVFFLILDPAHRNEIRMYCKDSKKSQKRHLISFWKGEIETSHCLSRLLDIISWVASPNVSLIQLSFSARNYVGHVRRSFSPSKNQVKFITSWGIGPACGWIIFRIFQNLGPSVSGVCWSAMFIIHCSRQHKTTLGLWDIREHFWWWRRSKKTMVTK